MVIFTVPHVSWSLKPIPVPRAHIPKLMELLKHKVEMGILELSSAPYRNQWFTVPKKNGSLRFIQNLQPVNKVTIRNVGVGPSIDEFTEDFPRKVHILSRGLILKVRPVPTSRRKQGHNDDGNPSWPSSDVYPTTRRDQFSGAHAMNKVLRDCIPTITMSFLDDILIKGCLEGAKDESIGANGCRRFVADHIADCEKILQRLEGA